MDNSFQTLSNRRIHLKKAQTSAPSFNVTVSKLKPSARGKPQMVSQRGIQTDAEGLSECYEQLFDFPLDCRQANVRTSEGPRVRSRQQDTLLRFKTSAEPSPS